MAVSAAQIALEVHVFRAGKLSYQHLQRVQLVGLRGDAAVQKFFHQLRCAHKFARPYPGHLAHKLVIGLRGLPAQAVAHPPKIQQLARALIDQPGPLHGGCLGIQAHFLVPHKIACNFQQQHQHQKCDHQQRQHAQPHGRGTPQLQQNQRLRAGVSGFIQQFLCAGRIALQGSGFVYGIGQRHHLLQRYGIAIAAGGHIHRQPAHTVKIHFGPCVRRFCGKLHPAAPGRNRFCRGIIALDIAGRNAFLAQRQHGSRGIIHIVARHSALQKILQAVLAAPGRGIGVGRVFTQHTAHTVKRFVNAGVFRIELLPEHFLQHRLH